MKVTNNKTGESYEVPAEAVNALAKSNLAKRFKFHKPVTVPAELKKVEAPVPAKQVAKAVPVATDKPAPTDQPAAKE